MKHLIVIQSIPQWLNFFKREFAKELPNLKNIDSISFTDSFDHAIDMIEKMSMDIEIIVITSDWFHDSMSKHRNTATRRIPDIEKNASSLAKMIKRLKPKTFILAFCENEPETKDFLDGFIKKDKKAFNNILEKIGVQIV